MELIGSEKMEKSEIELVIGISPDELDAAVNKAYLKNRNRIGVPGFRKGKAPRKIIEKMYGIAIFMNDAIESLLPDVIKFAMEDTEFDIVGYPRMTDLDLKDNDTRAEITLTAALRPEVKIGKYKGLSAPKHELKVTDDEVMSQIEMMRERNARLESVERPAALGDITVINFEGFIDGVAFEGGKGENYELELGSGRFIPGFEDKMVGMEVDEERDIDLVFPEDYKEDLAGKPVVFKVKILEIKEKQLPELDDDFAMDVSEFDTLEEYKASIRENIEKRRQAEIDDTFETLLMEQIADSMEADIPEAMIDEQADRAMDNFRQQISSFGMQPAQYLQMTGLSPEDVREKMQSNAERQVRTSLALEEIARLEKIEITPEEIEAEYSRLAEEGKIKLEEAKENVKPKLIEMNLKLKAAARLVIDSAKVLPAEIKTKNKKEKETEK